MSCTDTVTATRFNELQKHFGGKRQFVRPEEPKPLVTICGWCPGAREKTKALVEAGNDVSHGLCPICAALHSQLA